MVPLNMNSHTQMFGHLVVALVNQGLDVTVLLTYSTTPSDWLDASNVTLIEYHSQDKMYFAASDRASEILMKTSLAEIYINVVPIWIKVAELVYGAHGREYDSVMSGSAFTHHMTSYDFIILKIVSASCTVVLPYKYALPLQFLAYP